VLVSNFGFRASDLKFIKIAPENPVLWTGMKGVSAKSRKNLNQMLKQVQHDNRVRVSFFCHPELVSGSRFLVLRVWVLKPRPVGGVLYSFFKKPNSYENMNSEIPA
jgi:hypothetical protein